MTTRPPGYQTPDAGYQLVSWFCGVGGWIWNLASGIGSFRAWRFESISDAFRAKFIRSSPDRKEPAERSSRPLCMWVTRILATKVDDFAVAVDRSLFIFAAVMPQMTLHEPRFGMMGINLQNTIDENLRNFPSFFRNCPSSVRSIDTNL